MAMSVHGGEKYGKFCLFCSPGSSPEVPRCNHQRRRGWQASSRWRLTGSASSLRQPARFRLLRFTASHDFSFPGFIGASEASKNMYEVVSPAVTCQKRRVRLETLEDTRGNAV